MLRRSKPFALITYFAKDNIFPLTQGRLSNSAFIRFLPFNSLHTEEITIGEIKYAKNNDRVIPKIENKEYNIPFLYPKVANIHIVTIKNRSNITTYNYCKIIVSLYQILRKFYQKWAKKILVLNKF